ncbi:MAG: class I SAM-dependent methyltransferase [Pseudomonadota bacterium]
MNFLLRALRAALALCLLAAAGAAAAQETTRPFEPIEGQAGKDVVWVPTPSTLVDKMLDMARVTPKDYVMDLGSGDGRNIIAAARRGARALGVEYNPDMVELSKRTAAKAGVADKARFVQGDMYEADISQATVLALFLLPENLRKLTPKFLDLRPGTRIVSNTYEIEGWTADRTEKVEGDCMAWCSILLYVVPAKAAGTWRLPQGVLTLEQNFQMLHGTLSTGGGINMPIANGRLKGGRITFTVDGAEYSGRVMGDTMKGAVKGGAATAWTASRVQP